MAFKKVSGQRKYFKYAECTPGQVLVSNGTFVGTSEGRFGDQHEFDQDGEIIVLNSSGHLNWLLEKFVNPGDRVNVYYAGQVTLASGAMKGKKAHNFELEVDDGSDEDGEKVETAAPAPRIETTATRVAKGKTRRKAIEPDEAPWTAEASAVATDDDIVI